MFEQFAFPMTDEQWTQFVSVIKKGPYNNHEWPIGWTEHEFLLEAAQTALASGQMKNVSILFSIFKNFEVSVDELIFSDTCKSEEIKTTLRESTGGVKKYNTLGIGLSGLNFSFSDITDHDFKQILFYLKSTRICIKGDLNFFGNKISTISDYALSGVSLGGCLRLDHNKISKLEPYAFMYLRVGDRLVLDSNVSTELLKGVFSGVIIDNYDFEESTPKKVDNNVFPGLIVCRGVALGNWTLRELAASTIDEIYLGKEVGPYSHLIDKVAISSILSKVPMMGLASPELEWIPEHLGAPVPEGFEVSFTQCVERVKTVMLCAHRIAQVSSGHDTAHKIDQQLPAMPTEMWLAIIKEGCGGNDIIACLNGVRKHTLGKVIGNRPPEEVLKAFWNDQTPMFKFFLEKPPETEASASAPFPHKAPGE